MQSFGNILARTAWEMSENFRNRFSLVEKIISQHQTGKDTQSQQRVHKFPFALLNFEKCFLPTWARSTARPAGGPAILTKGGGFVNFWFSVIQYSS
jgi:hypothetical protein